MSLDELEDHNRRRKAISAGSAYGDLYKLIRLTLDRELENGARGDSVKVNVLGILAEMTRVAGVGANAIMSGVSATTAPKRDKQGLLGNARSQFDDVIKWMDSAGPAILWLLKEEYGTTFDDLDT